MILSCQDNIGLNMCINMCVKTFGCIAVNYDQLQFHCYMLTGSDVVNEGSMENASNKIYLSLSNMSKVSLFILRSY